MFGGGVGEWMYAGIAGLSSAGNATSTAWQHVVVRPSVPAMYAVGAAAASVTTVRGVASVEWSMATPLTLNATVPVGSTAEVWLPGLPDVNATHYYESGSPIWSRGMFTPQVGVAGASVSGDGCCLVVACGSGTYYFSAQSQ
jgi:hypothetical protein